METLQRWALASSVYWEADNLMGYMKFNFANCVMCNFDNFI